MKSDRRTPVEYEPGLVEEAVRFALGQLQSPAGPIPALRSRRRHDRQVDSLYSLRDPEEREAAFRRHYGELFDELGMDEAVRAILESCPRLVERCERVIVRNPAGRKEDAAAYANAAPGQDGRAVSLVLSIRPERLSSARELRDLLGPRLERIAALLDHDLPDPPAPAEPLPVCPACRLPTSVWAEEALLANLRPILASEILDWAARPVLCAHCAERYVSILERTSA